MIDPYYEDGAVTIYNGDALALLDCLDPSGDLAIFDPPYNVGKNYGQGAAADKLDELNYWNMVSGALRDMEAPSLVWTPGVVNIDKALRTLAPRWRLVRLLGWHKREYAGDSFHSGPAMCWEPIIWAVRAEVDKPFYNRIYGAWGRDFLIVNSTHGHGIAHPCPKPPEVMRWLIGLFCPEGGTVIDPMCGSGTALMEAKNSGRKAIGIELNRDYCDVAIKRCAQEVLAFG